jgi:hypothetical protein
VISSDNEETQTAEPPTARKRKHRKQKRVTTFQPSTTPGMPYVIESAVEIVSSDDEHVEVTTPLSKEPLAPTESMSTICFI